MTKSTAITKRILLIDDDEDLREIFYVTLSSTLAGLEVLLAESGEAGLAIAHQEKLDAIILDVVMPGMDGVEVLSQLQSNPTTQEIPVIFMTARTHAEDRQHLLNIGGKAVISKACKVRQTAAQIIEILNQI